ncbi:MAG: hypothetical protein A2X34_02990 [Elusimicrobia bacterium GWC2_51_8]|nr:MAG: hypothetical protein A2X33_07570 [Elusimicrobia bacterium GWA2_51_34]OGR59585.1 MAG: hypothetical protein A2X34_02990 [Elusimicrobia bacterium GWC2_51_8]OGR85800.1 MAG: hypothetical protein A2021_00240 [Elusimicrobia bacterium GWF2_52_66]HAF95845.1 hypothetical protein [Elusimicrobiota bacterium]HCE98282.1 hypothetical protein [Elusimicrobiota bacterium]
MTENLKSGAEIVADFFSGINSLDGIDKSIADALKKLYADGKLSNINISNALTLIRKESQNENKKH